MPRVILLEPCKLDVTQAAKWGKLKYIFGQGERRSSIWSEDFKHELVSALKQMDYKPLEDSLIIAGHMVPIAMLVGHLCATYGEIRTLLFNTVDRDYVLRILGEKQ